MRDSSSHHLPCRPANGMPALHAAHRQPDSGVGSEFFYDLQAQSPIFRLGEKTGELQPDGVLALVF
jgi:hypothetical protein